MSYRSSKSRENWEVVVNESAGACVWANPDMTPSDIYDTCAELLDPGLCNGWEKNPIFVKSVKKRIRFLCRMDADTEFDPSQFETVESPVAHMETVQATAAPKDYSIDRLVQCWISMGIVDPLAVSIVAHYTGKGWLSDSQLWHLGNKLKKAVQYRQWQKKRIAA